MCQQIKNNSFLLSVFITVFHIGMIFMFVSNDEYIIIVAIVEGVTKLSLIRAWMIFHSSRKHVCEIMHSYTTLL